MIASKTYRLQVLVLRSIKLKETDLIVELLRQDGSKLRGVAHGARKPKSAFASRLEPGAFVDVLVSCGRNLATIQEVSFLKAHAQIREDIDLFAASMPLLEFASRVAEEELEHENLFQCIMKALDYMQEYGPSQRIKPQALCAATLLKELTFAGFRPSLAHCVSCASELNFDTARVLFSAREGGLACGQCGSLGAVRTVSASAARLARDFLHQSFDSLIDKDPDDICVQEILGMISQLVEEHIGTRLRSLYVLSAL